MGSGESAGGGEILGLIEDGYAYINRSAFCKACSDAGISAPALLGYLKTRGLIRVRQGGKGNTVSKSVNKVQTECVAMQLPLELPPEWEDRGIQLPIADAARDFAEPMPAKVPR